MSDRIDADLVVETLKRVLRVVGTASPVSLFHSDQGSQYTAARFVNMVAKARFLQSMSRQGQCWDNAPMESFFSTLKTELDGVGGFKNMDEPNSSLFEYIEIFYNRQRPHSGIGDKTPIDFIAGA